MKIKDAKYTLSITVATVTVSSHNYPITESPWLGQRHISMYSITSNKVKTISFDIGLFINIY